MFFQKIKKLISKFKKFLREFQNIKKKENFKNLLSPKITFFKKNLFDFSSKIKCIVQLEKFFH